MTCFRPMTWIGLAFLAAGLLAGCGNNSPLAGSGASAQGTADVTIKDQLAQMQGRAVKLDVPVVRLAPEAIREELSITGELVPENSIIVKPLLEGRINFVRQIKVGDLVQKGEVIAKIDDRDIEDDIENQRKQIDISAEQVKLDEKKLAQQEKTFEFDKRLAAKGYITQIQYDQSELSLEQARISLRSSEIMYEQEQKKLERNLRQREKVPIEAPMSGMVVLAEHLKDTQQSNDLLNQEIMRLEDTLVSSGSELFGIISNEGYQARCLVNGKDKARLSVGQPVEATVITYKPIKARGVIGRIAKLQDTQSHAYKIWIRFETIDPAFSSGLFVRSNVELARNDAALAIERDYLKERNGKAFVQVVVDGMVKDVEVTTGIRQDERIELTSGVKEGDQIVASKDVFAADQLVNPILQEPKAAEGDMAESDTSDAEAP